MYSVFEFIFIIIPVTGNRKRLSLLNNNSISEESNFLAENKKKGPKPKKLLSDKEKIQRKSIKKTMLKRKLLGAIDSINKLKNITVPPTIVSSIRNVKLDLIKLDLREQKSILNLCQTLNSYELAVLLLTIPENEEQIKFLKEKILTTEYLDFLFRGIDHKEIFE